MTEQDGPGRRALILDFILDDIADQLQNEAYWPPVFPTYRQIGEAVGISSTSVVSHHLKMLTRYGILHHRPNHGYSLAQEAIALLPEEAAKHVRKLFKQE